MRSLVHYQWEDEPVRFRAPGLLAYAGWQSGLHFVNGEAKPALGGFEAPFVVDVSSSGRRARFWGQVRPGGAHDVTLLRRASGGDFVKVLETTTDEAGYWSRTLTLSGSRDYRFTWTTRAPTADAPTRTRQSGTVSVTHRDRRTVRTASSSAGQ